MCLDLRKQGCIPVDAYRPLIDHIGGGGSMCGRGARMSVRGWGCAWQGGMRGRGACMAGGACLAGEGACMAGGHAWQGV